LAPDGLRSLCDEGTMPNVCRCSRSHPNPTRNFWMRRSGCRRRWKHDERAADVRLESPGRNHIRRFAKGVSCGFAGFLSEATRVVSAIPRGLDKKKAGLESSTPA